MLYKDFICGCLFEVGLFCLPGAHGRFVPRGEGDVCREARTQTLEPDVWLREVQQRSHGTRRRIPLTHLGL